MVLMITMHSTTTNIADAATATAMSAEEMGNVYYKAGELLEAITQYTHAITQNPTSPLLRFNLSAAFFETGQYSAALQAIRAGIELFDPVADVELIAKLWLRGARCELHLGHYGAAREAAGMALGMAGAGIEGAVKEAAELIKAVDVRMEYHEALSEARALRGVFEVPKYRPKLSTNVLEYFNLGQDAAESQFDPATDEEGKRHSFFFSRVGDSRHLFATIVAVAQHEMPNPASAPVGQQYQQRRGWGGEEKERKYHFTMNDIKAHAAARNVLMLLLLHRLSLMERDSEEKTDTLALLFYMYLGILMPHRVHTHLQSFIQHTRTLLLTSGLPSWLWASQRDSNAIITVLDSWVEPMFPVTHAQAQITGTERVMPQGLKPKGCEREWTAYWRTGALFPPAGIRGREGELAAYLDGGPGVGGPGMVAWEEGLRAYVGREWRVNVTLVDREWLAEAGVWDVSFDPFSFVEMLYGKVNIDLPKEPTQLYDYFEPLFLSTGNALHHLGHMFMIETRIGDCCSALEEIRYGDKVTRPDVQRPQHWPRKYDTIHLSNLPDFTGGLLSPVLYALPVLKTAPHAHISTVCEANLPLWQTVSDYVAEYTCLPSLEALQAGTCLRLAPGQEARLNEFVPMSTYTRWQNAPPPPDQLPYSRLLPRQALTRWLLTLFFKIAVPPMHESRSASRVYSPLNLTAWMRLLIRVVELGYPPHWVTSLLEDVLANRVVTTIQPPSTCPLRIPDLEAEHTAVPLSTSPFIPELEVLLATWCRTAPFTVVSPIHLAPPGNFFEYSFTLSSPQFRDEFVSCLMLQFYPERILEELHRTGHGKRRMCVREMLSSTGRRSEVKCQMRDAVVVVSAWWWEKRGMRVTFRMREGWVEGWREEDRWVAAVWRCDDWSVCSAPTGLRGNLTRGVVPWGEGPRGGGVGVPCGGAIGGGGGGGGGGDGGENGGEEMELDG